MASTGSSPGEKVSLSASLGALKGRRPDHPRITGRGEERRGTYLYLSR